MELTAWRREHIPAVLVAARVQERAGDKSAKAEDQAAREERRREVAARRREVAGQLAAAAMSWSWNAWVGACMWVCLLIGLAVNYIGSYADLAATFGAFGYGDPIRWIMPLGVDAPATASVLGQLQAARWSSPWHVRLRLGVLTLVTAPLTLVGNALRGEIDGTGHFRFNVQPWQDLFAFAVPGLGVVVIGYIAAMMQGERAELHRRRLESEAVQTPARRARSRQALLEVRAQDAGRQRPATQPIQRPGAASRRRSAEVLVMVRDARKDLISELGREPSDEEVAERVTANGHRLSPSRTRAYLPEARALPAQVESPEEVVAG